MVASPGHVGIGTLLIHMWLSPPSGDASPCHVRIGSDPHVAEMQQYPWGKVTAPIFNAQ